MRLSEGVEWGLHCVVLAALLPPGATLPAARLAEFHGVPTAYLAKHLQSLSRAGILDASAGPHGGYRLARSPAAVTVLEVVEAIDGDESSFRCTEIRRRGPARLPVRDYRVPCSIHVVMERADAAWRDELRGTSIADVVDRLAGSAPPEALVKGWTWMQEVLR